MRRGRWRVGVEVGPFYASRPVGGRGGSGSGVAGGCLLVMAVFAVLVFALYLVIAVMAG